MPSTEKLKVVPKKGMAAPGHPKGGGRKAGTPNKATIEKRLQAARELDALRLQPKPLAKDRIEELGEIAFAMMRANQKVTKEMAEAARAAGNANAKEQPGNPGEFKEWAHFGLACYRELAKYQSPTMRAIAIAPAPEPTEGPSFIEADNEPLTLRVFEGGVVTKTKVIGENPRD